MTYTHDPPVGLTHGPGQNNQHTSIYKWDVWFRKPRFTLVQGKDYHVRTDVMAQTVRNNAGPRRYNVYVSIKYGPDFKSLTVTVIRRDGKPPRKPASARNGLKRRGKGVTS